MGGDLGEAPEKTGGEGKAEGGTEEGEHEAFGEELADEAAGAGPEGETDGDFALAGGGAGYRF